MAATLLRLRLTLLRHSLVREPWRVVLLVLGGLWVLAMLPSVLGGMTWLSVQSPDVVHDVLVVAGTVLLLGWVAVPLVVPALDDSLDVSRFRALSLPPGRLVPGLLLAALLGVPTAFTGMVVLAPVIAWGGPARSPALAAALLMAPLMLLTCLLAARVTTGLAARALGARRQRALAVLIAVVGVALVVAAVTGLGRLGLEGVLERVPAAAAVLAWTPFGAGWAVPAHVAQGDWWGATARAAVVVLSVVAGLVAWTRLLHLQLVSPPSRSGSTRRRRDAILPPALPDRGEREGASAARAILRRCLRYWASDPRYRGSMVGAVAFPALIVLLAATVVDAPAAVALSAAVLVGGSIGWGRHNDVAYDGTAFWLHLVAVVPGWADRLGRVLATLAWAVPAVLVTAVLGAVVGGRPDLVPAAAGAGLGVLGAGLAVSAVSSAVLVYPVPAAGANPFAAPPGSVGASLVAQLLTSVVTATLCVPVMVAYAAALWVEPALAWATLAVGLATAAGALALGVHLGGRVYDRRAVAILTRLARA